MSKIAHTGTCTAPGAQTARSFSGYFNFNLSGTFIGRVRLERRFEDSNVWNPCTIAGEIVEFDAPITAVLLEPENSVEYRVNCLSLQSGSIDWRLSQ